MQFMGIIILYVLSASASPVGARGARAGGGPGVLAARGPESGIVRPARVARRAGRPRGLPARAGRWLRAAHMHNICH